MRNRAGLSAPSDISRSPLPLGEPLWIFPHAEPLYVLSVDQASAGGARKQW